MNTSWYTPLSRGESHWLDVLRGTALMFVIFAHVQQIFISPYWFPHYPGPDRSFFWFLYQHISSFAMMTFFSMSGCLIYHSSMRNIRQFGKFSVKEYILSRMIRIYPPLLLSIGFLVLVYFGLDWLGFHAKEDFTTGDEIYVVRQSLAIDWPNIASAMLFLNTLAPGYHSPLLNGPLWSLAHEFWFYVFGLIFIWLAIRSRIAAIVLFIVVATYGYTNHEFWFYGLLVWTVGFVMTHLEYGVGKRISTIVSLLGAATFFGIWVWFAMHHTDTWYEYRNYYMIGIVFSFLLPLILRMVRHPKKDPNVFSRGAAYVAGFSYTMYLTHFPLFIFIFVNTNLSVSTWTERIGLAVGSTLLSALLAWYAAKYVENKQYMKAFVKRYL